MLFPLESYWHSDANNTASLGHEYLVNDAGEVSPVYGALSSNHTGGSAHTSHSATPTPTLVSSSGSSLEFNLIWDASVAKAPSGFEQAVIDAAKYYTTLFTSSSGAKLVINIDVGYGEIANTTLSPSALGESESYGYLTNYATVTSALGADGYSFAASNEPSTSQFFVTSAQAKALGMISGSATGVDGFIGFSTLSGTGYSWNFTANANGSNSGTGSTQFDLQAVAQHELSEVMGRIGMEGAIMSTKATYTTLDLFNFKSAGNLQLSGAGGYFSINNGANNLGTFNNAALYGGDITDWASYSSPSQSGTLPAGSASNLADSYNAFLAPGYNGLVSQADILADAALGYKLTSAGLA